jgi:hypothetical protein
MQYRFKINVEGQIVDRKNMFVYPDVQITDISLIGAGIKLESSIALDGEDLFLHFSIENQKELFIPIHQVFPRDMTNDGLRKAGLSFGQIEGKYRQRLIEYLYVTLPRLASQNALEEQIDEWTIIKEVPSILDIAFQWQFDLNRTRRERDLLPTLKNGHFLPKHLNQLNKESDYLNKNRW